MDKNTCSECILCCTLLEVPELNKPINKNCIYCKLNCLIYNNRPISCRNFKCAWLEYNLSIELKPNICHIIFEKLPVNPIFIALVDPKYPDSWKDRLILKLINEMVQTNYAVVIRNNYKLEQFFIPRGQTKENVLNSILYYRDLLRGKNNGCPIIHN